MRTTLNRMRHYHFYLACVFTLISSVAARSQEAGIIGQTLWTLPFEARLHLSSDGSTILAASAHDSTFYLLNAANGEILRRLAVPYLPYGKIVRASYISEVSNRHIAIIYSSPSRRIDIVDMSNDAIIHSDTEVVRKNVISLNSHLEKAFELRWPNNKPTYSILDYRTGSTRIIPDAAARVCWNNSRNLMFLCRRDMLVAYDVESAQQVGSWQMPIDSGEVAESNVGPWVFVMNRLKSYDNSDPESPSVISINTETGQVLQYHNESINGKSIEGSQTSSAFSNDGMTAIMYASTSFDINTVYELDARSASARAILMHTFTYNNIPGEKFLRVAPDYSAIYHSWSGIGLQDSMNVTCNSLAGVMSVEGSSDASRFVTVDYMPDGAIVLRSSSTEGILEVRLYSITGQAIATYDNLQGVKEYVIGTMPLTSGVVHAAIVMTNGDNVVVRVR